ncbi:protein Wnt-11-like [Planococcus citri]|uniref:protein Wnt-11-like n=1 Tax=Planococcus citri TaxID=170843 RepID=UPI0031F94134
MHTVKRYASLVITIPTHRVILNLIVVAVIVSSALDVTAVRWLSVHQVKSIPWNDTKVCKDARKQYGLTKQQTSFCKKSADVMPHVQEAAKLVVSTCEMLFRSRRWNCSSLRKLPLIKADLNTGTKERAIVHAMSTAALTYTVSRGCSQASISSCTCSDHPDEPPHGNFKWGGCGDNVDWASQFSRQFDNKKNPKRVKRVVSKPQKRLNEQNQQRRDRGTNDDGNEVLDQNTDLLNEVHNHNGEMGRKLVSESLTTHCKCHGVSGSCSIKTCWRGLPMKFSEIGESVMVAYNRAVQVHTLSRMHVVTRYENERCLLYVQDSPNYCVRNPKLGIYGTSGRDCDSSLNAAENCDVMCCGRGYSSRNVPYYEKCRCQYNPARYNVVCEKCTYNRTVNTCK